MKIRLQILWIAAATITVVFSSCRARFYTPNRNPVPLFKNAGDGYFDFSTNLLTKVDLTAGFAPIKSLGTYIGYSKAYQSSGGGNDSGLTAKATYHGEMLNLGLGYFLNESNSRLFRFEIYGDLGLGNFNNRVTGSRNGHFNGNYTRIGIMPNFGFSNQDGTFNFAYSARFSTIMFSNSSISDSSFWSSDIDRLNSRSSYAMLEHALVFRAGSPRVKFQVQLAAYHGLSSIDITNAIPVLNASIMFGLVISPNFYR